MTEQIQKKFEDWFTDFYGRFSFRIEHFYADCEEEDVEHRKKLLKKWMVASFHEGYERGMLNLLEQQDT
jgi:hypothetical protein